MARPTKNVVALSDEDVMLLKKLVKDKNTTQTIYNRCRVLLARDINHLPVKSYEQCCADFGICHASVANIVKLYVNQGLEATLKLNRNINSDNARRKVDGDIEAKIIKLACSPAPDGHARWTLRLLENRMRIDLDEGISREAIRRALKKTNFDLTETPIGV